MANVDLIWGCDASLPDHKKVGWLADALRIRNTEALGVICRLYCRVRRNAPCGDVTGLSEKTIADWCGHPRATIAVLQQVQLLDIDAQGRTVVHGWAERGYAEYDAKKSKERAATKERTRVWRERNRDGGCDVSVTPGVTRHGDAGDGLVEVEVKDVTTTPLPPQGGKRAGKKSRRRTSSPVKDPSPEVVRLHAVWCEATERDPQDPRNTLDAAKAAKLEDLVAWAGSPEAAERGVRKVGASPHHRGQNAQGKRYDRLDSRPFITRETFLGWCEDAAPEAAPTFTWGVPS